MCKSDNCCLYDAVHSTTQILDKKTSIIEMVILREMIDSGEIAEITWRPTDRQIADALTKKGFRHSKFLDLHLSLKDPLLNF